MFDTLPAAAQLGISNLLTPAILFFALGMGAGFARSDLTVPEGLSKGLALYLMLCIGFKGGVEARVHGLFTGLGPAALLGVALSLAIPVLAYGLLRRLKLDRTNAAATAAHYGSVSLVTFAAAGAYLEAVGLQFGGYMAAVLALMETPAILVGLALALRGQKDQASRGWAAVRHVLLGTATVVLMGSFLIGLASGKPGLVKLDPFVNGIFQGALCLFLLDMGLVASRRLMAGSRLNLGLAAFAIGLPVVMAMTTLSLAGLVGLSQGDGLILAVLAASASYIAVPAAMKTALPEADPGLSIPMALGITFPFNLLVGIPLYHAVSKLIF